MKSMTSQKINKVEDFEWGEGESVKSVGGV